MSYMKDAPIAAEFSGAPASDDEKVRYALRRERIGQQRFRTQLFEAYTGRCAVSGCNVDEALEAAHIENYSGPKSQVVSNGILLRRDLHSLFDAHLISFELVRGDYQLCGSYLLRHTEYATFAGSVLRRPDEHRLRQRSIPRGASSRVRFLGIATSGGSRCSVLVRCGPSQPNHVD